MKVARIALCLVALAVELGVSSALAERVLIDCPGELRPAMEDWVAWRQSEGHDVRVLGVDAVWDDLETGDRPVLVLVGDGLRAGLAPRLVLASVISRYGPEPTIASDHTHGSSINAKTVARLPFDDAGTLRRYLDRVRRRELAAPSWGEIRLQVVAGVGGFSPLIDAAIEGAAKRLVRELAPPGRRISLRRVALAKGSTPPIAGDGDQGGVTVWLGHGLRDRLPGVRYDRLAALNNGSDAAVLLACYTGDFAAPGNCVAEQLLRSDEGPLAVIASTRVSMPYGNARLGGELLSAMNRSPNAPLGELFGAARLASLGHSADRSLRGLDPLATLLGGGESLAAERAEHALMYHLLGDPLVQVGRSTPLSFDAEPTLRGYQPATVRGTAPMAGLLRAEWASGVEPSADTPRAERRVAAGEAFSLRLAPPAGWRSGERTLRVGVLGDDGFAFGARSVRMEESSERERVATRPLRNADR